MKYNIGSRKMFLGIKSIHFKKTVSKVLSFLLALF